jgi:hypothetical protein
VTPLKEMPRLAPAQSALLDLQRSHGNQFVVGMLQGKCSCGGTCPKCSGSATVELEGEGGQPLDARTRAGMESRLGQDFSEVRVHSDQAAARAAEGLDAQAFTVGQDIFFASGKYRPDQADPLLAHELVHVAQQNAGGTSAAGYAALEAQAEHAEHAVIGEGGGGIEVPAGARGVQRKPDDASAVTAAHQQKSPTFLERIGHGIASAAETVWQGIKAAGTAIGTAAAAAGRGIATAAEAVWTGLQWVGRQLWDKATGVFERVMHWITRLPERLVRLIKVLWEGVRSVQPWALKWWESLAKADTWSDFLQWLGTNLINILEVAGVGELYETVMDFIKFNTRKMTGTEMDEATGVFGGSINLELVRIDEHAVLGPSWTKRAYTSFHVINGWGGIDDATLIHELTHVWQYQQAGAIYMPQALHAQGAGGYAYDGAQGLKDRKNAGQGLLSFNREQQAQIVEDFYLLKTGREPLVGGADRSDLPIYAHFVKEVSTHSLSQLVA